MMNRRSEFEWDSANDRQNQSKHGILFALAQIAFLDHDRVVLEDLEHSGDEKRFYCIGKVHDGILTVRFTYREQSIRIIGAGYGRKGKRIYEKENDIR